MGTEEWENFIINCDKCKEEITILHNIDYEAVRCTNKLCTKGLDLCIPCFDLYNGEPIPTDSNSDSDNGTDSNKDSENGNDNGSEDDSSTDDQPPIKKQKLLNGRSKSKHRSTHTKATNRRNTRKRRR